MRNQAPTEKVDGPGWAVVDPAVPLVVPSNRVAVSASPFGAPDTPRVVPDPSVRSSAPTPSYPVVPDGSPSRHRLLAPSARTRSA